MLNSGSFHLASLAGVASSFYFSSAATKIYSCFFLFSTSNILLKPRLNSPFPLSELIIKRKWQWMTQHGFQFASKRKQEEEDRGSLIAWISFRLFNWRVFMPGSCSLLFFDWPRGDKQLLSWPMANLWGESVAVVPLKALAVCVYVSFSPGVLIPETIILANAPSVEVVLCFFDILLNHFSCHTFNAVEILRKQGFFYINLDMFSYLS